MSSDQIDDLFEQIIVTFGNARSSSDGPGLLAFRCDSATYLPNRPFACIFTDVLPFFEYSLSDDAVDQAAAHIKQAQDSPNSTTPPVDHVKFIPGKYPVGPPLTRDFYADGGLTPESNNDTARRTCDQYFPPYDGNLENCDEYPFKTTYQGAASAGDFSVKVIAADDNQEAGSRLGNWYTTDRILDGDSFDISIVG